MDLPGIPCTLILAALFPFLPFQAPSRPAGERPGPRRAASGEDRALEEVKRHLSAGGDVDAPLEGVKMLLGYPAFGVTRLHQAAERGWIRVARYLLDHGADPKKAAPSKSRFNRLTPIDVALHSGRNEILLLLKRRSAPPAGKLLSLVLRTPPSAGILPLVSFDEGRWTALRAGEKRPLTCADLLIEPSDPQFSALTGKTAFVRHAGADAALALLPGKRWPPGFRLPRGTAWKEKFPPGRIGPGDFFLVRTGSGTFYAVRVDALDALSGKAALTYVRLFPPGEKVGDLHPPFLAFLEPGRPGRPPTFLGARCGFSREEDLLALFGPPRRKAGGSDLFWEKIPFLSRLGIEELRARFDEKRILRRIQITLASPLPTEALEKALSLGRPDSTRPLEKGYILLVYAGKGIMAAVKDQKTPQVLLFAGEGERAGPSPSPRPQGLHGDHRGAHPASLRRALLERNPGRLEALLSQGSPPGGTDPATGETLLFTAVRLRMYRSADILLRHGADPGARNAEGMTPLHAAALLDDRKMAGILLKWGADPRAGDRDGMRPYELAGDEDLAAFLEEASEKALDAPPYKDVRLAVEAWLRAVAEGDAGGIRRCLPPTPPPGKIFVPGPVKIRPLIRNIEIDGDRARVEVKIRYLEAPPGRNLLGGTVKLKRFPGKWAVCGLTLKPVPEEEDRR